MTKLRVGLVGLGMMGRHHKRILSQLDGVDFVGIFDPAAQNIAQVDGPPVFTMLNDLVKLGLDYCVIAAPTAFHLELGLKLAAQNIHCLIEKPVAVNTQEALQLVEAFSTANLIGAVGHIERFNPAIQAMRQKIDEGLLGEIFQISTRRQGPFPARIADVGVIKDLATHDIDLTSWVARSPYASVSAHTIHKSARVHEDMVVAIGRLESGVIVNHVVNWLSPFKERNTTVTGERGALVADTLTADLTFYANGLAVNEWDNISTFRGVAEGDVVRFALKKTEPLLAQHIAFRDAVNSGMREGVVTLREGLAAVAIADQMLRA